MSGQSRAIRTVLFAILALASRLVWAAESSLRIGIIGCDTSHVVEFTKVFNNPDAQHDLAGLKVVTAFPGGSEDIPSSRERVGEFTQQLRQQGVVIVDSIQALLDRVDVVLLESLDGRKHLEQARAVIAAGKPLFIDKPVAAALSDVLEIYRLAADHGVPCFSSSAMRFSPSLISLKNDVKIGDILGCDAYSPCPLEPHHPDLFWYGIHGVEALYTVMGPGCQSVTRTHTANAEIVVGIWKDGRIGTFRGMRGGPSQYGVSIFGSQADLSGGGFGGYEPLVAEIARFFHTHQLPVSAQETLEIYAFMEAADESKRQGGKPIALDDVMQRAQQAHEQIPPATVVSPSSGSH